ncbi:MAG: plsX [Chlamydiales bacterium]|jgi:glycerol-3-phosphate acyltransferase PlsX|nr:plsX [Chlamydiales bacterium]
MGSDCSPDLLLQAVIDKAKEQPCSFALFAHPHLLPLFDQQVSSFPILSSRLSFIACPEVVEMQDDPFTAVRRKRNSSLIQGLNSLADGEIDGFVSAGNTGALFLAACLQVPLLPSVSKPALAVIFPFPKAPCLFLDVGGNVTCTAQDLVSFASLGQAYFAVQSAECPRLALLNIGSESLKGTIHHKNAFQLLQKISSLDHSLFKFIGNVEPDQVLDGAADVVISEGFSGNIFLKTTESCFKHVTAMFKQALAESGIAEALLADSLHRLGLPAAAQEMPGALLLGLSRLVVKCHGQGNVPSLLKSIQFIESLIEKDALATIAKHLPKGERPLS